jgi:hypothetical protein
MTFNASIYALVNTVYYIFCKWAVTNLLLQASNSSKINSRERLGIKPKELPHK